MHKNLLLAVLCVLLANLGTVRADDLISNLSVKQTITAVDSAYLVSPQIQISFTLAEAAPVTIHIERHQNNMQSHNGPYLVDTYPVRDLDLGQLPAGEHHATWDGLNSNGEPVTRQVFLDTGTINREKRSKPEELVKAVQIDLFKIIVESGNERHHVNFRRRNAFADANLKTYSFSASVVDSEGHVVLVVGSTGRGYRVDKNWSENLAYIGAGQSADPLGAFDCAIDSRDDFYVINHVGVYRFTKDGPPASWKANADYLNYPYPSNYKTVLGVRLDQNARGRKQKYTFGPGGNGHYKYWDTAEQYGKPGFSLRWSGVAIDKADNIYLASADPAEIQVFNNAGDHLRTLKMQNDLVPGLMRFGTDGTLWTIARNGVFGLDPQTGAITKHISDHNYRSIFVDHSGIICLTDAHRVARYDSTGEPLAFSANTQYKRPEPNIINILWSENKVPRNACGYINEIGGIGILDDGTFFVSERHTGRLLKFSRDGIYQPLPFAIKLGQHQPGNIFLDDKPASFDLFVTSFAPTARDVELSWTITDFDDNRQTGTSVLHVGPSALQTVPLVVPAPENGHYRLHAEAKLNGQVIDTVQTMFARIPSRRIYEDRFSPFAMCWGNNYALMAYAGVKSHRGDSASWDRCLEPRPGVFYPQQNDAQNYSDGIEGPRRYARRWGVFQLNGLDYGEGWLGNYNLISRIWSYDRFYRYVRRVLDTFAGKGEAFYQFWNEPNFFWHVPGPFGREHFGLVTQHLWSMVKARDKDAFYIPDGDAGGVGMMEELAGWGMAGYLDGVQIHYPGSRPITMNNMPVPNTPEGKVPMCESLINVRDKYFPGKPAWNTEEGWWGIQSKSLKIGAELVPRTCIPQLAAGIDKIYWFMSVSKEDTTYLLNEKEEPYPTYVSYATMTRLLDPSIYAGQLDLGPGNFGFLFARKDSIILAVWRLKDSERITLPVGTETVPVTDIMNRTHIVKTVNGNLPLTLTKWVQYLTLPRSKFTLGIARQELAVLLKKCGVNSPDKLPDAIAAATTKAAENSQEITHLYYLIKAAELAAVTGDAPVRNGGNLQTIAASVREMIESKEGKDGYLRQARVVQEWVDRLAKRPISENAWPITQTAAAASRIAEAEKIYYPGIVINAFIGEPGEVERIRAIVPKENDYSTTIDEKFRFQIAFKPGDTFELELTIYNHYTHTTTGQVAPRLPAGWQADKTQISYDLQPGQIHRVLLHVNIPVNARPGIYTVGGTTTYNGTTIKEIHPQRIEIQ